MRRTLWAGIGGVAAAVLGTLCCIGPLLFVTLGVGAGLASTFEPLRPVFGLLMAGSLGVGFYTVYGRRRAVEVDGDGECGTPGEACAVPLSRRRDTVLLWTATVIALVAWSFPTWSKLFV